MFDLLINLLVMESDLNILNVFLENWKICCVNVNYILYNVGGFLYIMFNFDYDFCSIFFFFVIVFMLNDLRKFLYFVL